MDEARDPIPAGPGVIPPAGWVLVEIQGQGRFWIDPRRIAMAPRRQPDPSRLTPAQKERIRAFKQRLGPLDPASLDETFESFSLDQEPDREIAVWEKITDVYELEVSRRPGATERERALVYVAALCCANAAPSVDALLSVAPQLKALPDLQRVVQAYRDHGT